MAKFQGFNLKHTAESFTDTALINTECMFIDLENQGQQTANIQIKGSNVSFPVGAGESIRFPASGNTNPFCNLSDSYNLTFAGAGTKKLVSTKCYAISAEINL